MRASIPQPPHAPYTQRFAPAPSAAFTVWLTGLSGAGKTTLAEQLLSRLRQQGRACGLLDGDVLRKGLSSDLGFSREHRCEQVRRVAHVARIMNEAGVIVIVALVSPYRADRQMAREIVGMDAMHEVWVCASLDVCRARDTKGLYRLADAGQLPAMTGVGTPYEPPLEEALRIDTTSHDVATCVGRILEAVGVHAGTNASGQDVRGG